MFTRVFWRGFFLVSGLLAAGLLVGCGDDDDSDDRDEDEDVDLIALVVAAFEEEPRRLPDGIALDEVAYYTSFDATNKVADLDFTFTGGTGEHYAVVQIFRTEADARAELDLLVEDIEGVESKKERGHYCAWWEFGVWIGTDDASSCVARTGNVTLEVETGPVPETEPEAAMEMLLALERFLDDLAEDATRRVRDVPTKPLAALLGSLPPPAASDGFMSYSDFGDSTDLDQYGLVDSIRWTTSTNDKARMYFQVFEAESGASSYHKDFEVSGKKPGETHCGKLVEEAGRYCVQQFGQIVILAARDGVATAPGVDPALEGWMPKLSAHLTDVRGGKLTAGPKAKPTPSGTRTPTPSGTRTPTPGPRTSTPAPGTPTLPPSSLTRVSAGTWTFTLTVSSNNCPGGLLPPGSTITRVYEFVDSDGDGFISRGESFSAKLTSPVALELGKLTFPIPNGSFVHPSTLGLLSGLATVQLTFTAENRVDVSYVEDYKTCKVSN